MLLAIALLVGVGTAVDATPAAAAAPKYGTATICFKAPYTMYGRTYWGPYNRTVRVDAKVDGDWYEITTTTPNLRGCLSIGLAAGYRWRFRVYHHEAQTWYVKHSRSQWIKAGHSYRMRTVWIQTSIG